MNEPTKTGGEDFNKPAAKISGDFRNLKCTLPEAEFDAVQWSAKRAGQRPHPAMPLADFMRAALLGKVREVVRGEIARGKAIPPDIAATLDERRKL